MRVDQGGGHTASIIQKQGDEDVHAHVHVRACVYKWLLHMHAGVLSKRRRQGPAHTYRKLARNDSLAILHKLGCSSGGIGHPSLRCNGGAVEMAGRVQDLVL